MAQTTTADLEAKPADGLYRLGTLAYTKRGLLMLFIYLLWGDFCFTIMESIFPTITPLTMHHFGAKLGNIDFIIAIVTVTIPNIFNTIVCPWVSFKSDRHRGKWGRRIPFLLFSTPFISLFLIMIGLSPEIGSFLGSTILRSTGWSQVAIILGLIAVFSAAFQYFNMFAASVYYYLFNDVVPEQFLGRFMAAFRMVGLLAGATFNFLIFRYADIYNTKWLFAHWVMFHHSYGFHFPIGMKWIFIYSGILYFVAFTQMSMRVKEGEYPPAPEYVDGKQGVFSGLKTYFGECFSNKFYWYFFLSTAAWELTACAASFNLLFQTQALGLTTGQIGIILGWAGIVAGVLVFPAGWISDKKHPLRTTLFAGIGLLFITPTRLIYLFYHFTPAMTYRVEFALQMMLVPLATIYLVSNLPMYMRVLPRERFGQFCSAQAMFRSGAFILCGFVVGGYMMLLKKLCAAHHMPEFYYYKFVPTWTWALQIISVVLTLKLYQYWKMNGGDESYTPPPVGKDRLPEETPA